MNKFFTISGCCIFLAFLLLPSQTKSQTSNQTENKDQKGEEKQVTQPVKEFDYPDGDTVYHMKEYYLGIYLRGEHPAEISEEEVAQLQKAHLAHISKLGTEGKVLIAGPLGDNTEKRGILVFDVENIEEATRLMADDPSVKAGRMTFEIHPWWAAKGSMLK